MPEILAYPFIQRALVSGIIVGTVCALLGVFVVVRRMSFFGDAISHSAFTGVALGFLLGINPSLTALFFAVLVAAGMGYLQNRGNLSADTTIGIFFSGSAALGLLIIALLRGYRADLFQYLFGDILSISDKDLLVAVALGVVVAGGMARLMRPLLQITFNRDMAKVAGVPVELYEYLLMVLLAVTVAVSLKIVGIILVTALLIVPAAAAKNISGNFRQMVGWSVAFGIASTIIGLVASYYLDTSSGPTIVLTSILIFCGTLAARR